MAHPEQPDLDRLLAAVEGDIAEERGPVASVRTWPRAARFALVAMAMAAVWAFFHGVMGRMDLPHYPPGRFWALFALWATVALGAAWHALRPIWMPPAPTWVTRGLLVVGLLVPVIMVVLPAVPTQPGVATAFAMGRWAYYCLANGTISGLAVLLLARAVSRGGHRGTDEALLASVGAGLAGVASLHLECPANYPLHLLTGHVPVPLLLLLLYRFARRT
jgi:hypothetical protein